MDLGKIFGFCPFSLKKCDPVKIGNTYIVFVLLVGALPTRAKFCIKNTSEGQLVTSKPNSFGPLAC